LFYLQIHWCWHMYCTVNVCNAYDNMSEWVNLKIKQLLVLSLYMYLFCFFFCVYHSWWIKILNTLIKWWIKLNMSVSPKYRDNFDILTHLSVHESSGTAPLYISLSSARVSRRYCLFTQAGVWTTPLWLTGPATAGTGAMTFFSGPAETSPTDWRTGHGQTPHDADYLLGMQCRGHDPVRTTTEWHLTCWVGLYDCTSAHPGWSPCVDLGVPLSHSSARAELPLTGC